MAKEQSIDNSGTFKKRKNNFTQISNHVLKDENLSHAARGLYCQIYYYITIPDYVLTKNVLMNHCKEGQRAFNTVWKELKEKGYLVQEKTKVNNKYCYFYDLLDVPSQANSNDSNDDSNSTDTNRRGTKRIPSNCIHSECTPSEQNDSDSKSSNNVAINNTCENNTQGNNTEQNNTNSFIPSITLGYLVQDLNELREGKNDIEHIDSVLEEVYSNPELHDFKKELESAVYRRKDLEGYTFNDFVVYAAIKTNFKRAFTMADDNEQRAYNYAYEWLLSYAGLMSQTGNTIKIGSNTYKLADLRERLIQVNEFTLTSLIDKIKAVSSQQEIKNFGSYMQKMWIDACFDSGNLQADNAPLGGYSNNF